MFSTSFGKSRVKSPFETQKDVFFEVSPYTGFMGSAGLFGARGSMNYRTLNFEMSIKQVIGKTANLYPIDINGVLNLTLKGQALPYGTVGAGLAFAVPGNTIGGETVTTPMVNFGAGLKYFVSSFFGFRFETKMSMTQVKNKFLEQEEILIFQEFTAGLIFILK